MCGMGRADPTARLGLSRNPPSTGDSRRIHFVLRKSLILFGLWEWKPMEKRGWYCIHRCTGVCVCSVNLRL